MSQPEAGVKGARFASRPFGMALWATLDPDFWLRRGADKEATQGRRFGKAQRGRSSSPAVPPGNLFVVEGSVAQTAVEDADQPIGQSPQSGVVVDVAAPELVVIGPCPR